jgi:phosphopantothenoylcysteine decarboxylase/phosphopantothenate--cysteine ligase
MNIVVGVTGGIAAYKTAGLVSKLVQSGHRVRVMMTRWATKFVGPVTFGSLTGQYVATKLFDSRCPWSNEHISLADWADKVVIAPATASCIGKLARGITDDLLTCTVYATATPVWLAPAMNTRMWEHPVVQENVAKLRSIGYRIMEPGTGYLACGHEGQGRMAEVEEILEVVLKQT